MFERFTDLARRAMVLAKFQALAEEGCQQIGPRHILCGILQAEGFAVQILESLGVDTKAVIHRLVAGPKRAVVDMSERPPLDEDASRVCTEAISWAERLGCDYVGTEHLLMAAWPHRPKSLGFENLTLEMLVDRLLGRTGPAATPASQQPTNPPTAAQELVDKWRQHAKSTPDQYRAAWRELMSARRNLADIWNRLPEADRVGMIPPTHRTTSEGQ